MKDILSRVQRELPDTDQTRYDVAYERGRAQARSTLLFGGLAVGSAVGGALMWLFDPGKGAGRRAQLGDKLGSIGRGASRSGGGKMEHLRNRVEGFAIERGAKSPPAGSTSATAADDEIRDRAAEKYGEGYREGFGQTEYDPTAPGSTAPDPIRPAEVATYGSSGPIAGATLEDRAADDTGPRTA